MKSCLIPSPTATYMGMGLVSPSLRAFYTLKRVTSLLEQSWNFSPAGSKVLYIGNVFWVTCPPYVIICWVVVCTKIHSTRVEGSVGLPRRFSSVVVDSGDRVRPHVVVDARSLLAGVPCLSSTRPSLLVRRVGSGLGVNLLACFVSGDDTLCYIQTEP